MIVGIISDTHGLLREKALKELKGCDLIIHAGDIGRIDIIEELEKITKVICVRGNCDKGDEMKDIPETKLLDIEGIRIYIIHDIKKLKSELNHLNLDIVIYGHSHKKDINILDRTIYVNPGSIGPKRFKLPTTMAKLYISEKDLSEDNIEFIEI